MQKKILILVLVLAAIILAFVSAKRETVGVDRVGVLSYVGGHLSIYQPGDNVLILPLVSQLTVLSSQPILFAMKGDRAITAKPAQGGKEVKLVCQVRYQVLAPLKLISQQGAAPQGLIEALMRAKITALLQEQLDRDPNFMTIGPSRAIFVAETTVQLNEELAASGIKLLAFELPEG